MLINEIETLLDQYQKWLKDKTTLRQVNDWVEISTPYLDRHNDYIQIYVKKENANYLLTDDGWIINDLEDAGCSLDSAKRQALLKMTLNGFGVQLNNGRIETSASSDSFSLRKHNLIQAMLAVNDLFYLAAPIVANLFYEDVVSWLETNKIRYTPKVKFTGKSGYDHLFDFVVPKSSKYPERVVRTINHPTKEAAQSLAFSWIDTKDVRPPNSSAYAILNDSDFSISPNVISAIRNYEVSPILWSKRNSAIEQLAA